MAPAVSGSGHDRDPTRTSPLKARRRTSSFVGVAFLNRIHMESMSSYRIDHWLRSVNRFAKVKWSRSGCGGEGA